MTLIWATRGRTWGFRFLRDGGLEDPLDTYEEAFAGIELDYLAYSRVGERTAVRFPDPLGRQDSAGRVIPHEFVILGPRAAAISSVDDAVREVWPLVADEYAKVWDKPKAPRLGREQQGL